jgi:hypothetical protein
MEKKESKYSLSYQGGKCPYGFEYVEGYQSKFSFVPGYCRKIKKRRFTDPEAQRIRSQTNRNLRQQQEIDDAVYEATKDYEF